MRRKVKFEFTITGFLIALVLVGMFAASFGSLIGSLSSEYGVVDNATFSNYENFQQVQSDTENIKESTDFEQNDGIFDVIGAYFGSGYSALKLAFNSIGLFYDVTEQASSDVPAFSFFAGYLGLIILIGLVVGVIVSVLVKMRM